MNEGLNKQEPKNWTKEEAENEVMIAWQGTHGMGGDNFEPSDFTRILKELKNGICSPEEAVRRARRILERKIEANYH